MSDSSDDDDVPVAPRGRKRRKLVPRTNPEDDAIKSSSSSSCAALSSASLTTLSTGFLRKTSAIDAGPAIKKQKAAINSIPTAEEEEKRKKDYQFLISSSSDEENLEVSTSRVADALKSPSPPPPPPPDTPTPVTEDAPRRGGRGRRRSKRKSTPAGAKTSAKANKGLKAVQQLRSLHDQMKYQTQRDDLILSLNHAREGLSEALKEDEIELKIRSPSGVQRLRHRKNQSLAEIFIKMAEIEDCGEECVVMTVEDREVKRTDSPMSLGLTIADILECLVLRDAGGSSSQGTEGEEGAGDGTIKLKIQSLDSKTGKFIVVKVRPDAPLSEMMDAAAKEMGVEDGTKLTFRFDGEVVKPDSTAADYDMEDDDCVDVLTRK